MKERFGKIIKRLRSNKGETIMECIASLLVLAILMVAVTTMIQASMRMTGIATQTAAARQTTAGAIMLGTHPASGGGTITFSSDTSPVQAANGIGAEHPVTIYTEDNISSFIP